MGRNIGKMGSLRLTFLGTGTSLGVPIIGCSCEVCSSLDPKDKRLRASALITTDKGTQICIDSGPDFREQMLREHIDKLDAVLITHEHRDHTAGLDDIRPFNYMQQRPMPIYGNKEAFAGLKKMFYYAFEQSLYPGIPEFELHEINPHNNETIKFKELEIIPVEVLHAKLPTLAYRIGKLAYVTDAKYIVPEQEAKLQGVDVLVVNALRKEEHFSHFNIDEAVALSRRINAKTTYLTHLSQLIGPHETFQKELPPNIFLAYDGLQIESEY